MPDIIAGIILANLLIFGPLALTLRGKVGFGAAYAWGALFGGFGLIIILLLSIRAEIAQPPVATHPRPIPRPPPNPEQLQALADAQTPVGQL